MKQLKKIMERACGSMLLFGFLGMASPAEAQLSTNPDKFLGNITTRGSVNGGGIEFASLWNQLTAENESKWGSIEGSARGQFNWSGSDACYNYCKRHNIPFKFHTLIWGGQYPGWMDKLSKEEQYKAVVEWMDAVKKRYPDLQLIDVVNEAITGHAPAPYKDALGGDGVTGYDWIIKAFEMAHERWPNAILIYNDYNTFQWNTDQYIDLVKTLRDAGAPVDAYGCQSHDLGDISLSNFKSVMSKIHSALLMPMYSTEYDIGQADDNKQLKQYQDQIPYMWESDYVAGITLWGYINGSTWVENTGIIDNGKDRPAMTWLREYMASDAAKKAKGPFAGGKKEASVYIKPSAVRVPQNGPMTITVNAALATKTIAKVALYQGSTLLKVWTEAPYTVDYDTKTLGYKSLRAVVTDTEGNTYERRGGFTVHKERKPFGNNVIQLPGTLQAENFDLGGEGVSVHDNDAGDQGGTGYRTDGSGVDIVNGNGGRAVGYINAGEWLEYTVNVNKAGRYVAKVYASAAYGSCEMTISVRRNGSLVKLGKVNVASTNDWNTYKQFLVDLTEPLEEGEQQLRITFNSGSCNLDKLVFEAAEEENIVFDPNFQVYLCFGQSNMEGNATVEAVDRQGVSDRFETLTACTGNYSNEPRLAGHWYKAVPPLCRANTGLTPADYFGRLLLDSLPETSRVGIVMVALGGASIDVFDINKCQDQYDKAEGWFKGYMDEYGGNPYARLVELGKQAQKRGVIKGVLLHQGETDNGQANWVGRVKTIYNRLLTDLGLSADSVPLLAGEMRYEDQGGICYGMNTIINRLPRYVPTSYVISAEGIPGRPDDGFHFTAEGTRELGKRYGQKMWELLKASDPVLTGIADIQAPVVKLSGVYDLWGRKVLETSDEKRLQTLRPGMYIVNGRKVLVNK